MTNDALKALDAIDKFIQQCNDYEGQWPDDVPKLFIGHTKPIRAALAKHVDVEGLKREVKDLLLAESHWFEDDLLDEAIDHLAAQGYIGVPEGWKLVPIEPTDEMLKSAYELQNECAIFNYGGSPTFEQYYSVMIKAAPKKED